MNKTSIFLIVIGILFLIGAVLLFQNSKRPSETLAPLEIEINYDSNTPFEPQLYRVEQGQMVTIKITSNIEDKLHLHGYDVATMLHSDHRQDILQFQATKTGRFDFELEKEKKNMGVIEVYPS